MKKSLLSLLYVLVATAIFSSCEIETSDNGKLDGYWKLCSVDTLATGNTADLTEKSLFWSVQAHILAVQDNHNAAGTKYLFRFQQESEVLKLYEPQIYNKLEGNKEVTDAEPLRIFGINALESLFRIESLSGKQMTLSNESIRLHFKKF